jgi:hypothetical protein
VNRDLKKEKRLALSYIPRAQATLKATPFFEGLNLLHVTLDGSRKSAKQVGRFIRREMGEVLESHMSVFNPWKSCDKRPSETNDYGRLSTIIHHRYTSSSTLGSPKVQRF